jgi:sugar/nucleoside kinase (ribokinase family)
MRKHAIDILAVGELLIDMISTDFAESMDNVEAFKRIPGGSPANLGMNMKRLGNNVRLVSTVGNDDFGRYLLNYVESLGLETISIHEAAMPTTLIIVSRSKTVSNFEAYLSADAQISKAQLSDDILGQIGFFHTTCFALSRNPAQGNILAAATKAVELGAKLSIDANYAQKIWKDTDNARQVVADYCSKGAAVKISEVDWARLYGQKLENGEVAATHFLDLGASEVCVTLGGDGCFVASKAEGMHFLPARPVEVKDTTGAGDAFWSGYLTARLDEHSILQAAMAGRRMAELKLAHFGPLPQKINRSEIYTDF